MLPHIQMQRHPHNQALIVRPQSSNTAEKDGLHLKPGPHTSLPLLQTLLRVVVHNVFLSRLLQLLEFQVVQKAHWTHLVSPVLERCAPLFHRFHRWDRLRGVKGMHLCLHLRLNARLVPYGIQLRSPTCLDMHVYACFQKGAFQSSGHCIFE